jgi:hypothetical protein
MASSTSWVTRVTVCRSFAKIRSMLVAHAQAHQGIERGERLVHVENLGLDHQRASQLHRASAFLILRPAPCCTEKRLPSV